MIVSVAEAHVRLSQQPNPVNDGPTIIRRRANPVGVIISPEKSERLSRLQAYLEIPRRSQLLRESSVTADALLQASRDRLEGQL